MYYAFPIYYPTSFKDESFDRDFNTIDNSQKKIKVLSLSNIIDGICQSAKYIGHALAKLIKEIALIFNIVIARLALSIAISPLIAALPPANAVFPQLLIKAVILTISLPTIILTHFTSKVIPAFNVTFAYGSQQTSNLSRYLAVGLSEELMFRGVIQQGILKRAPKKILQKFFPNSVHLVDHTISRISRVIFTSFLFALAHSLSFGNQRGMLLPQFIGGVIYGTLVERNASLLKVACIHTAYNIAIVCLLGGI